MISTLAEANTLGQSYSTGSPNQRKIIRSKGLFWTFFSDGKNLAYRASPDGYHWNDLVRTKIFTGRTAESISIWCERQTNEIYYSKQVHKDKTLELGHGVLESNGSVSWLGSALEIRTKFPAQFPGTFVCSRKQGDIWIGTTTIEREENRHTEIWKSDGFEYEITRDVDFGARTAIRPSIILPTPSGILVIYGRTHHPDRLIITLTNDGKDWTSPFVLSDNYCLGGAAIVGRSLYYCGPSNGVCRFFTLDIYKPFIDKNSVLGSENVVQSTLATDGNKRLVAIYSSSGPVCSIYYRSSLDLGETWGERKLLVEGEPIAGFSLTSSMDIVDNKIGVAWSSGLASPFKIRFGKIEV